MTREGEGEGEGKKPDRMVDRTWRVQTRLHVIDISERGQVSKLCSKIVDKRKKIGDGWTKELRSKTSTRSKHT